MRAKEDVATPKIIGSQKQHRWILDQKHKWLMRHAWKALFMPSGAKECAKGWSAIEPDSFASLPLALDSIHQRLSKPEELKKLHLQHHRRNADQSRFRTCALDYKKLTHDLFDKIRSECEVCQAAKQAEKQHEWT